MKKFAKIIESIVYYAQYVQALLDGLETFRNSLKNKGLISLDWEKESEKEEVE